MTRATLAEVLLPALCGGYAVPGFVCLGWEDARAYALAAEDAGAPVILQAGPGARAHMPVGVWGAMLGRLADSVAVPVVIHLDHGRTEEECREAIGEGFTSVMFDGSALALDENIRRTAAVAAMARAAGVSCEGEIGVVGYTGRGAPRPADLTDPGEAARFARETGVDAMAVAVGNVHLRTSPEEGLDEAAVAAIEGATGRSVPLVIHGGSGVAEAVRARLARGTAICKFNIGTELRQTFGAALRTTLAERPEEFDRLTLLAATEAPLRRRAGEILRELGAEGRGRGVGTGAGTGGRDGVLNRGSAPA